MATTPRRSTGDAAGPIGTFSYAQAAKGISSASTSAGPASKAPSGSITPAKDASQPIATLPTSPSGLNWADDGESISAPSAKAQLDHDKTSTPRDAQSNGMPAQGKQATVQAENHALEMASPEFGTASSSTLGKDDDVSSLVNTSSESTWENKSQGSVSVDKFADQTDVTLDQSKADQQKEKAPVKTLHEAPPPTVNFWKQRADDLAKTLAKPAQLSSGPKKVSINAPPAAGITGGKPAFDRNADSTKADAKRKSKQSNGIEGSDAVPASRKERRSTSSTHARNQMDDKSSQARRDVKSPKAAQKEEIAHAAAPLPPTRDEQSWPTPEIAQDGDRKKSVGQSDKEDKERAPATATRPHGKSGWVPMAYTPTVVFNTPLPNSTNRRGGRGGTRGASQSSPRPAYNASGAPDKELSGASTMSNGDNTRRERVEDDTNRDASPEKSRRTASVGPPSSKEHNGHNGYVERNGKPAALNFQSTKKNVQDETATSSGSGQSTTTSSKQPISNRQRQARKFDNTNKEGDATSSPHDVGPPSAHTRAPNAVQSETDPSERKALSAVETSFPHSKHGPSDRRNGHYGPYAGRERGEGRGRGGIRGSRGGQHAFSNASHLNGHLSANGQPQGLQGGAYAAPRSPTAFSPDQQSSYFGPPSQSRSFRGNGSRSQSIPVESAYGRAPNGYPNSQHNLPPIQTYNGGMYDYPAMQPMSAVPFAPYVEQYQLFGMIQMQLEYYFSVENLCKDMFMRKHMDSKGFVYLSFIADFNRIKQLTTDMELIKLVCYQSRLIEYRLGVDGKDRLRRREGWDQWVLNMPERDLTAQNDGPEELHHPPVPHPQGYENQLPVRYHPSGSGTGPSSPNGHPNDSAYQPVKTSANAPLPNGTPAQSQQMPVETELPLGSFAPPMNGDSSPPTSKSLAAPTMNPEADSFSDEQVEALSIIVRKQEATQSTAPFHSSSSRTFSNGSIDSRSISEELHKSDNRPNGVLSNGLKSTHGEDRRTLDFEKSLSPRSSNHKHIPTPLRLFWVKDKETPVESLPPESTCELYTHLRFKALEQRHLAALGICPYDMDVLYQFWSHFLIRNFNTRMYNEFRRLAFEDINHRMSDNGIKNLIKYYGEALSSQSTIRERVARHYVLFVTTENMEQERPAFKQLRVAWRNGALNMKNRKKLGNFIDASLKAALET